MQHYYCGFEFRPHTSWEQYVEEIVPPKNYVDPAKKAKYIAERTEARMPEVAMNAISGTLSKVHILDEDGCEAMHETEDAAVKFFEFMLEGGRYVGLGIKRACHIAAVSTVAATGDPLPPNMRWTLGLTDDLVPYTFAGCVPRRVDPCYLFGEARTPEVIAMRLGISFSGHDAESTAQFSKKVGELFLA